MRETAQTRVASLFLSVASFGVAKVGERMEFVLIELIEKVMYRTLLATCGSENLRSSMRTNSVLTPCKVRYFHGTRNSNYSGCFLCKQLPTKF